MRHQVSVRSKPDAHLVRFRTECIGSTGSGLRRGLEGFQVGFFVFHCPPESFNDHDIVPTTLAVHAGLDLVGFQQISEL